MAIKLEEQIPPEQVPISEADAVSRIPIFVQQVMLSQKNRAWLGDYIYRISLGKAFYVNFAPPYGTELYKLYGTSHQTNLLWLRLVKFVRLTVATHLITAGRFEDAAKIYEQLGMYPEAGKVRAKGGEIRIKRTEVSIDLNSLLREVKEGGIVLVYRCPHCGGKLKVGKDTSVESLKRCEHCGSEIEAMDLADFLKTALS